MDLPDCLIEHPNGEICVAGHRISLYNILSHHVDGDDAERLAEQFPTLSVELIRRVLEFYDRNRPEADAYVAAYRAGLDRLEAMTPKGVTIEELRRRLEERERAGAV